MTVVPSLPGMAQSGRRSFSAWSGPEQTLPLPTTATALLSNATGGAITAPCANRKIEVLGPRRRRACFRKDQSKSSPSFPRASICRHPVSKICAFSRRVFCRISRRSASVSGSSHRESSLRDVPTSEGRTPTKIFRDREENSPQNGARNRY